MMTRFSAEWKNKLLPTFFYMSATILSALLHPVYHRRFFFPDCNTIEYQCSDLSPQTLPWPLSAVPMRGVVIQRRAPRG